MIYIVRFLLYLMKLHSDNNVVFRLEIIFTLQQYGNMNTIFTRKDILMSSSNKKDAKKCVK